MEIQKEEHIWTKLNPKEVEEVREYYLALDNSERDKMPPILKGWYETILGIQD